MALRRAPALAIRFEGGIETKEDSKTISPLKLLNLENATFIKQTTLAKRNGYASLGRRDYSTGLQCPDFIGMAIRDVPAGVSELVAFDGERSWSYRDSVDGWADAGEVDSVVQDDHAIARTATQQTQSDHATNGGVSVVAWVDSRGGVWCEVIETVGERVLVAATQLDSLGSRPRCIPCGTVLHVIWAKASTSELWLAVVNPANVVTPTKQLLTTDLSATNPEFDACVMGGSTYAAGDMPGLLAWSTALGWRLGYVSPSGVIGSPLTGLPSAVTFADIVDGGIAVAFDKTGQTLIGVAYTDNAGTTHVKLITATTLAVSASVSSPGSFGACERVTCEFSADELHWALEHAGARADLNVVRAGACDLTGTVTRVAADRALLGHTLATRAYHDNGEVYAGVCHAVKYFPYVAVAKLSTAYFGGTTGTIVVAHCQPGTSTGVLANAMLPSVQAVDPDTEWLSRQHRTTLGYRIQLPVDSSQAASSQFTEDGIRLTTLDHDHASSYQTAQLGGGLYLAAACMRHYDGRRWTEAQMFTAPDTADGAAAWAVASVDGSGAIAAGDYNYVAVYEHVDALGEETRGAVAVPITVTVGGGGTNAVTCTLPTYRLTFKERVRISVYRSEANQTGDPDSIPYFRVTGLDPSDQSGANCYVQNDPTTDTITFLDILVDADLKQRTPLYTNGGILSNDPAPCSGNAIAGGKGRLFWTDPSDPLMVRYSQQREDDTAMETSVALSMRCDPYGGPVVALGAMDDAVYPFKATAVMVFGGPGPDADGGLATPNAFSPVELVTGDVGCSSPTSICQSPEGIAFQSSKGIKLLDRQRNVQDIGSAVYALNDQVVARATLLPDRHQILFLTASGYTLLWDYERGQWGKYTNHEGYDAVVRGGLYYYVRTDGRVFKETPGLYADDNSHIPMKIETAWLSPAQYRQGWARIWHALVLGAYKSAHTLRLRYRIDYQDAYAAPLEANVNANWNPSRYGDGNYGDGYYGGTLGDSTVYQREFHLNKRCQAIAFEFTDVEDDADFGASFELSELLLTGGMLGPRAMVGAARRG